MRGHTESSTMVCGNHIRVGARISKHCLHAFPCSPTPLKPIPCPTAPHNLQLVPLLRNALPPHGRVDACRTAQAQQPAQHLMCTLVRGIRGYGWGVGK